MAMTLNANGGDVEMIDDIGITTSQGGPMGPGVGYGMNAKQHFEEQGQRVQHSMPGILHFLQSEWARFEMEKAQWEVERAELYARMAFLQGERKGQTNLIQDLVRRIQMLEFALKQERAKFHKLKFGMEQPNVETKQDTKDEDVLAEDLSASSSSNNQSWRQGRQLLRQYLQEIGYTDAILDVRSARVRTLLGLHPDRGDNQNLQQVLQGHTTTNGESSNAEESQRKGSAFVKTALTKPAALSVVRGSPSVEGGVMDSEASVLAAFDFQSGTVVEDEDDSDEENEGEDGEEDRAERRRIVSSLPASDDGGLEDEIDADTEEALAEFDFLVSENNETEARTAGDGGEWGQAGGGGKDVDWAVDPRLIAKLKEQYKRERGSGSKARKELTTSGPTQLQQTQQHMLQQQQQQQQRPNRSSLQTMLANLNSGEEEDDHSPDSDSDCTVLSGHSGFSLPAGLKGVAMPIVGKGEEDAFQTCDLGLGDLADITVSNDVADVIGGSSNYEVSSGTQQDGFKKTWVAKYTLRSHFDGIRALSFHPVEPVLLTASEDHTLKLWNLQKTVPSKKTAVLDVEPVYTFRGHVGAVLCLATNATGEQCYSGGIDTTVRCWNIPSSSLDPYDSFDSSVLQDTLVAHTDAVWGLAVHSTRMQLLSCSADGTVRLWSPGQRSPPLLHTYFAPEPDDGAPTCVDFLTNEPSQMMAAYTSGNAYIYDLETGKVVIRLNSKSDNSVGGSNQINKIVNHPTLPLTMSAHDDRHIKFFDSNSGQLVHSMVAHLDAVTSLAVDPNGLYLLSGSHDCSIRLWSIDSKTCVQEITSHRKKWDEAIFDVAFHPTKPYIASAGADGLAKVFV